MVTRKQQKQILDMLAAQGKTLEYWYKEVITEDYAGYALDDLVEECIGLVMSRQGYSRRLVWEFISELLEQGNTIEGLFTPPPKSRTASDDPYAMTAFILNSFYQGNKGSGPWVFNSDETLNIVTKALLSLRITRNDGPDGYTFLCPADYSAKKPWNSSSKA